jgi:hypothetical protein
MYTKQMNMHIAHAHSFQCINVRVPNERKLKYNLKKHQPASPSLIALRRDLYKKITDSTQQRQPDTTLFCNVWCERK